MEKPVFPPLLRGEEAAGDPFDHAARRARAGADPGLVAWVRGAEAMRAAIVLVPDDPLCRSIGVFLAAPLALGDALAAIAPPALALHYGWPRDVRVNGAVCGRVRAAAASADPATVPDWLVLGIEVPFRQPPDIEGGERPDETCLHAEGCGDVGPIALLESWSRHMLVWINRWTDRGTAPLRAAWQARAWGLGEPLPQGGVFAGLDENGGMLVETAGTALRRPLTEALER